MSITLDAKKLKNFDYLLFIAVIAVSVIGIFTIKSTEAGRDFALRQALWVGAGAVVALLVSSIDTRKFKIFALHFYVLSLLLLLGVVIVGVLSHGARRWISLYAFTIQPSEFIKIAIILMLAYYFDENPKPVPYGFKDLLMPLVLVLIPVILVIRQPDLGTAVIIVIISLSIVMMAGVKRSVLIKLALLTMIVAPLIWSGLKPYQKDRIFAFINPYSAPTTFGYHVIQSEIAIGSGGIAGKGIKHATQALLNFLPESHTDFIFSVFSEEWGLVGDLVLLALYLFILLKGINIAKTARETFDRLTAVGIVVMMWVSFLFNVGMTMGFFPVVGIPLLFMSYGGSAILSNFFALGILLSIKFRSVNA